MQPSDCHMVRAYRVACGTSPPAHGRGFNPWRVSSPRRGLFLERSGVHSANVNLMKSHCKQVGSASSPAQTMQKTTG